jgi:hypothetical protein
MSEETDKQTAEALERLVQQLGAMNTHNEAMLQAQQDSTEAIEENGTGGGGRKNLSSAAKAIPLVGHAVTQGSNQITQAITTTNKIQKEGLGRGLQLSNYASMLNQSTTEMTKGLGGYGQQLQAMVAQFDNGMRQNVEPTRKLALYTQLTGGNSKKMMKDLRDLTKGTGLSVQQEGHLSNTIIGLSKTFNMTGDELIGTMKGLQQNMSMLKGLGIAPEIQEAAASLGAMLGPGMGQAASNFANELLGAGGNVKAAMLGVTDIRQKLLAGEGDATELLREAMMKAGTHIDGLIGPMEDAGVGLEESWTSYSQQYGAGVMETRNMLKALNANGEVMGMSGAEMAQAAKDAAKASEVTINTWDNLIGESFSWLVEALSWVQEGLFKFIGEFPGLSKALVNVAAAIAGLMAAMKVKAGIGAIFGGGGKIAGGAGKAAGGAAGGLGKGIGKGLEGLGKGLKAIGSTDAMKGAVTIGLLAASLAIAAYGFTQFANVEWGGFFKGIGGLTALAIAAKLIAKGSTQMVQGAAAIALLGAALLPMAFAMTMMNNVGAGAFTMTILGLIGLAVASNVMAVAVPGMMTAAAGILVLAIALIPMAAAMWIAAKAVTVFFEGVKLLSFKDLGVMMLLGPALTIAAVGIVAFGAAALLAAVPIALLGAAMLPLGVGAILMGTGLTIASVGMLAFTKAIKDIKLSDVAVFGLLGVVFAATAVPLLVFGAAALIATPGLIGLSTATMIFAGASMVLATALRIAAPAFTQFVEALGTLKVTDAIALGALALVMPLASVGFTLLGIAALIASPGILALSIASAALGVAGMVMATAFRIAAPAFTEFVHALGNLKLSDVIVFGLLGVALPVATIGIIAFTPAIWALGLALFPLATAMAIATPAMEAFMMILYTLSMVPLSNLLLVGPALVGMAAGFVALSAGGLISNVVDGLGSLFGGDSPVDKLVKMGEAAKHINKMNRSLQMLPDILDQTLDRLDSISLDPFDKLVKGLAIVKAGLDEFGLADMAKFALFGKAINLGGEKQKGTGLKSMGKGRVTKDAALGIGQQYDPLKKGPTGTVIGDFKAKRDLLEGMKGTDPTIDQKLQMERLNLAKYERDQQARLGKDGESTRQSRIVQGFIDVTERNILVLEEIRDNGQIANEMTKSGVKVKAEHRPMSATSDIDEIG